MSRSGPWSRLVAGVVFCVWLAACELDTEPSSLADEEADPRSGEVALGVRLDAEQQRRLGLATTELDAAQFEQRLEGPGTVVDAQPIVQVLASLTAAEAAARLSRAARERADALFGADMAVSREVLEGAERQAAADAAALEVARAEALVAFGAAAPWLDSARRGHIVEALTEGLAVVVRASFPSGLPAGVPGELSFRRIGSAGEAESWQTNDVWAGPADPSVPGPSLLAYVEPAHGLVSGARLVAATKTGERLQGVSIPVSAVVIVGGTAWCYVAAEDELFVRTPIDLKRPLGDAYFQPRGFESGQAVVTGGAGLLLARELGGAEEED